MVSEPLRAEVVQTHPAVDEEPSPAPAAPRLESVDVVRGLAMVLMALDHVRYFVTDRQYSPENLLPTTVPLFFTRWVTHFCAPAFFLLAGTGAMLSRLAGRSDREVRGFLWKRGALPGRAGADRRRLQLAVHARR